VCGDDTSGLAGLTTAVDPSISATTKSREAIDVPDRDINPGGRRLVYLIRIWNLGGKQLVLVALPPLLHNLRLLNNNQSSFWVGITKRMVDAL
jgi:hypothetical protein